MAAPKKPVKPGIEVLHEPETDDIADPHVPDTVQGEPMDAHTATAASQMAKLEPDQMWLISNPPIVYFIERHFPVNGRWEKETLTIRAGSYEEYVYKRGLFELEWEEKYERIAMALEHEAETQPAPPSPPRQPAAQPPAQQRQPQAPSGAPYCETHGEYYRKHEKNGETWYSHQVSQKPDGKWTYCRP